MISIFKIFKIYRIRYYMSKIKILIYNTNMMMFFKDSNNNMDNYIYHFVIIKINKKYYMKNYKKM